MRVDANFYGSVPMPDAGYAEGEYRKVQGERSDSTGDQEVGGSEAALRRGHQAARTSAAIAASTPFTKRPLSSVE